MNAPICCVEVYPREKWGSFNGHRCGKPAKVERDGKHYCGIHDPARGEARQEKWRRERDARDAAYEKRCAEERERDRRAACYPELIAALETAVAHVEGAAFRDNVPWLNHAKSVLLRASAPHPGRTE